MRLPDLPYDGGAYGADILSLGGLNRSDRYQDGQLAHCENLSTRRWPRFSTRSARRKREGCEGVTALTVWGEPVYVKGYDLFYAGEKVGTVTPGEKQFAVVNTKLVIWPDKKYLDLNSRTLKPLGAELDVSGGTFTHNTLTVKDADLTLVFKAGDAIELSGCTTVTGNNKSILVRGVTQTALTVSDNAFTEGTESSTMKLVRRVPDLDFICASENRLWGCSSDQKTIYASALGDPTNFFVFDGLSTDSYAVAVGTDGDFTGCCTQGSAVLFWKEAVLHKLMGSFPAEYALYTYHIEGLKAGCHKSLVILNEVLYYLGLHGVYAYAGGTPTLVSSVFGNHRYTDGVAGSDGQRYVLSAREGEDWSLLVYDPGLGMWLREDDTRAVDFARQGAELLFANQQGEVWSMGAGEDDPDVTWSMELCPMYETLEGNKRYSKLLIRMELPRGAWMGAQVKQGDGRWKEVGKRLGSGSGVAVFPVPISRGDKFTLRLYGQGPCTIFGIRRQFRVGSER